MRRLFFFLAVAMVLLFTGEGSALPPDPAARGLDLFLHLAKNAAPGSQLEVLTEAFGFATTTKAAPLAGATIEAGWDPEELDGVAPPPPVTIITDNEGKGTLSVPVPRGLPRNLTLLVGVRHGAHSRTRKVTVHRSPPASVEIHTIDTRVVPTSTISSWVRVAGISGQPIAGAPVVVALLEGGVARHTQRLVTDKGGLVMARVPIPRIDEPVWEWTLRATAEEPGIPPSEVHLRPREETPGKPTLEAKWEPADGAKSGVLAGDKVPFTVRLRDATGQALSEHPVRYWIGQRGTAPPATDEEWTKQSTVAKTDGGGRFTATKDAPTLVKTGGTALLLIVKTTVEGHALEQKNEIPVGVATASVEVTPEAEALVPGLTQKIYVHVADGRGKGIAGSFKVTGDGLDAKVTTNAEGEGEVTWNVPVGVGATRNVGPCAGGVAAAVLVKPEGDIEALRRQREGFSACVSVDRDAGGLVRVEPTVARPGDKVRITVTRAKQGRRSFSALSRSAWRAQSVTAWLEGKADGSASGEITLPNDATDGLWSVSVASPDGTKEAAIASAGFMVVPRVLPLITAKRTGGRATPGGTIEVEAQLTDGAGRGLPGSISGIVVDAFGGGRVILSALDTRLRLCGELGIEKERCNDVLANDPKLESLRRAHLASMGRGPQKPEHDPGGHAEAELKKAFADVLHSLEGAVFESTKDPQTLIDVRRKENGRWVFNPELLTLVTDAMSEPPLTPGGERITLADLVAVDAQVNFDNVARRVTRLKLFRILQAVRDVRSRDKLDPDEPVFKDPNALVRRLVRSGLLAEDVLLDPWGGTIQFVQSNAAPVPFLTVARGWELRAPGPDGLINTGDDVRDPFQRVLAKGTPYANAVEEDRIVDAKWDMVVSEETVQSWQRLFEELTGTELGAGGMGLSGTGEGGGGRGEGIGLGNVGTVGHGSGRGTGAIATGDAYWTAPVRTDAEGRVRLTIPLGDVETTWRIAFVGVPDGAQPAATSLDVSSELPLSSRIDVGARWVEGDIIDASVLVRNRGTNAVRATVSAAAEGAASIDRAAAAPRIVDVPANGARTVRIRVSANRAGTGALVVTTRAPNLPDDVVRHTWEVIPAGEHRYLARTAWVDGEKKLSVVLDHGYRIEGTPRVVLERGYDDAIAAALDSLEPERQTSTLALLDAYEVAVRVERWATTKSTPRHKALAAIAHGMSERALGRFFAYVKLDDAAKVQQWTLKMRARLLSKVDEKEKEQAKAKETDPQRVAAALCPPDGEDALDAEPPPSPSIVPCWGAYVADKAMALERDGDAERVARGLLAIIERPHRLASATSLAAHLRAVARLGKHGELDVHTLSERPSRAIVYAALLRSTKLGPTSVSENTLFAKLAELRDANGGYGSSTATLYVVRALLASQLDTKGASHVRVRSVAAKPALDRRVDVPESGFIAVPLPAGALDVEIETEGAPVVARLERPVLRLWKTPPPPQTSPVAIEITWPSEARVATTGTLRVSLRQMELPRSAKPRGAIEEALPEIDARIPLPPGVTLAASLRGVTQIQGALFVRQNGAREGSVIEIPVRFGLSGRMTAPEASARMTRHASPSAFAPARSIVVR